MSKQTIETLADKDRISFTVKAGDVETRLLNVEDEQALEAKFAEIDALISANQDNTIPEEKKDELYAQGQRIWNELKDTLTNTLFQYPLNRDQYKYLTHVLVDKLEYNSDTVFFALGLVNLMKQMEANGKYANDTEIKTFGITATDFTYLFHILKGNTVKGLGKQAHLFAEILKSIGSLSKIFKYYDNQSTEYSTKITNWIQGISTEASSTGTSGSTTKKTTKKSAAKEDSVQA